MSNPLVVMVDEKLVDIDRLIHKAFDRLNAATYWFPDLNTAIRYLSEKVKAFWEWIGYYWINRGDEAKLKKFAQAWEKRVGDVLGDIARTVSPNSLASNDVWSGEAAVAYGVVVRDQIANLQRLREFTDQIRTTLDGLAGAIHKFCKALLYILTQYAVALVAGAAAAATGVGAPAAAAELGAATVWVVSVVGALTSIFSSHLSMFISTDLAHDEVSNSIDDQKAALQRKASRLEWNRPELRLMSGSP